MRTAIAIVLAFLIVALAICSQLAKRSAKAQAPYVMRLLLCLLPPMLGNLVIIVSGDEAVATVGCYMYYIGIDLTLFALLNYTLMYCGLLDVYASKNRIVHFIILADIIQLALNPIFHHAFALNPIMVDGMPYYKLVPYIGQTVHRVLDYGMFVFCLITFIYKTATSPRIYSERYSVILMAMLFTGAWQTFYVLSWTPVDRSMIGYAVFGLLVFYFSLYYRPLRLLDRMLSRIVSDMDEGLFFFDPDGKCIYANEAGCKLVDMDQDSIESAPTALQKLLGHIPFDRKGEWDVQRHIGRGENARFFQLTFHNMADRQLKQMGAYLSVRDRTAEERSNQEEIFFARHDRLTGLFNKEYLYVRASELMEANPEERFVVVALDVRDFKIVNDIFGTEFGDMALKTIATWMKSLSSEDALYGRLSGDKFGLITPVKEFHPGSVNQRLNRFVVSDGEKSHAILMHLGVYEVNEPDLRVSVMFDRAFMAIASIKDEYQVHIAYYSEDMRSATLWDQTITAQLSTAISERQIVPYLQPIVDGSGKAVGAEVLVRWIHPTEGFLAPYRFIPVFEHNGMIAELDVHMWRCACELLNEWQLRGIDLFLSVNISPKDFYFMDVFEVIRSLASEYCIDPGKLRLEITETVMMTDLDNRMQILNKLRRYGFLVEMDDFGSGYSTLNMLKDMPVDLLKIDMAFLYKSDNKEKAQAILQSIVDLARKLGILSLTEGVETSDQFQMLADMGCELFQGYYFAKPMPVAEYEEYCQLNDVSS